MFMLNSAEHEIFPAMLKCKLLFEFYIYEQEK